MERKQKWNFWKKKWMLMNIFSIRINTKYICYPVGVSHHHSMKSIDFKIDCVFFFDWKFSLFLFFSKYWLIHFQYIIITFTSYFAFHLIYFKRRKQITNLPLTFYFNVNNKFNFPRFIQFNKKKAKLNGFLYDFPIKKSIFFFISIYSYK